MTILPALWEAFFNLNCDHQVLDGDAAGRLLARIAQLFPESETL